MLPGFTPRKCPHKLLNGLLVKVKIVKPNTPLGQR